MKTFSFILKNFIQYQGKCLLEVVNIYKQQKILFTGINSTHLNSSQLVIIYQNNFKIYDLLTSFIFPQPNAGFNNSQTSVLYIYNYVGVRYKMGVQVHELEGALIEKCHLILTKRNFVLTQL